MSANAIPCAALMCHAPIVIPAVAGPRSGAVRATTRAMQQAVEGGSTWCPSCGELLVERDAYEIGRYARAGDRCSTCNEQVPGVFAPEGLPALRWGRRRRPLRIMA